MTTSVFPPKSSRSYALLVVLQQQPGTFYQTCERAGFSIEEPSEEEGLRRIFDHLICGNVCFDGIHYHLTDEARRVLDATRPTPYVGQIAGPAYRGTPHLMPVTIARRAAGARA